MAKKKIKYKNNILMILYWAVYLTATMALFEHFNIVPGVIPFGVVGWLFIVEIQRVIIGWAISMLFFKELRGK